MPTTTERLDWGVTGQNLYAAATSRTSGQWWNGTAMAAYADANWSTYAVPLAEIGTSGIYLFTVPAGLPPDDYDFLVSVRAGGTAALGDTPASSISEHWDGATLSPLAPAGGGSAGSILDLPLAGHGSVGTVGEALTLARALVAGKRIVSGTTLLVYDVDGITLLATLPLTPAGGPFTSVGPAS